MIYWLTSLPVHIQSGLFVLLCVFVYAFIKEYRKWF